MNVSPEPARGTALAARIRALCQSQGIDMRELAERAGVSPTTFYNLEAGRTEQPHASTLKRIAAALGVTPSALLAASPPVEAAQPLPAPLLAGGELDRQRRFDRATNSLVAEVAERHSSLFAGWSEEDWDELYSTFGTGGPLNENGILDAAARINTARETLRQLHVVLDTHLHDVAVEIVRSLYRMVRPGPTTD